MMNGIHFVTRKAEIHGPKPIIMGIDYNTTLELYIEGVTGNGTMNARISHHPKARHRAIEFCKQIGLYAHKPKQLTPP